MGWMMWRRIVASILCMSLTASILAPSTVAQEPPPDVGDAVVEDSLTQAGLFQPSTCATGRNQTRFVEDGLLLRVTGKCSDTAPAALIGRRLAGLTMLDGEVRLDVRTVSGAGRVELRNLDALPT